MKKPILLIIFVGIISAVAYLYSICHAKTETASVMSLLRSEPMAFLVTRRIVTQIVVHESSVEWYSQSRAILWATVNLHYGCNLDELKPDDLRRTSEGNWLVRLPQPRLLDFNIESLDSISKDTFFAKAEDILFATRNHRMMERLRSDTLKFAEQHSLLPTRDEMVSDLNRLLEKSTITQKFRVKFE